MDMSYEPLPVSFEEWKEQFEHDHPEAYADMSEKELQISYIRDLCSGPVRYPDPHPEFFSGCENCDSKNVCPDYAMAHSYGCNLYDLSLDIRLK